MIPADEVRASVGAVHEIVADGLRTMPGNLKGLHGILADVDGHVRKALARALDAFDDHLRPLLAP